jgi:protein-tyrosine-phosphatase
MPKTKVSFPCTGNSVYSQMAEGYLHALTEEPFKVFSVGTEPQGGILVGSHNGMREVGGDILSQWLKLIVEYTGNANFGYAITVDADTEENCLVVFPGTKIHERRLFADPAKIDEEERFTSAHYVIEERLRLWLIEG